MRYKKPQKTTKYSRKMLKRIVSFLSITVVFCTTYALILPAITMGKTTYCGMEEHQHTDSCYEKQLICDEEHEHTDDCYEKILVCNKKEHEHTLSCYSNSQADVETSAAWEKTMADVKLEGDWNKDLVAIAESQLGYTESSENYIVDDNENKKGYSRYGDWYGDSYGDWSAMFVSFCLHYADIPKDQFPYDSDCANWIRTLSRGDYNLYHRSGEYDPVPGDIIFFDCNNDQISDHVGIVKEVEYNSQNNVIGVKTIEGDLEDTVKKQSYSINDGIILGYGQLPKKPEVNSTEPEDTSTEPEVKENVDVEENSKDTYTYQDKDVEVIATYIGEGSLPEGVQLVVNPYKEDDETYKARFEEAQKFLEENDEKDTELKGFDLYDIHFEKDGEEIEPDGTVNVQIIMTGIKSDEETPNSVMHFAEKEIEMMDAEVTEKDETVILEFETESFSDYAVNYYGGAPIAYFVKNNGCTQNTSYYYNQGEEKITATQKWGNEGWGYYVTAPSTQSISMPFNYTLNGWYDFNHNKYYKPGEEFRITEHTVLYADWIAANYNASSQNAINTPDFSSFIKNDVFDYNELFNMNSLTTETGAGSYVDANGHKEVWTFTHSGNDTMTRSETLNFGFFDTTVSKDKGFIFLPNGRQGGRTGSAQVSKGLNYYEGILTEGIASTNGLLDKLFSPQDGLGKKYVGSDSHLYQYDANSGYYYYDSVRNAAAYNQNQKRFYVYNYRVMTDASNKDTENKTDFLPFNDGTKSTKSVDGIKWFGNKTREVDYWFGMKSEISFYLPNQTGSKDSSGDYGNKSAKGDDMIFKFAGDDDIWVFVDDQLVLDLGGVHDVNYGEINFATGEVKRGQAGATANYYPDNNNSNIGKIGVTDRGKSDDGKYDTVLYSNLNIGEGEHKITVYYIERGASQSNCAVYFNVAPRYSLDITKQDKDNSRTLLAGARFAVYTDVDCTKPANLWDSESQYKSGAQSSNEFTVGTNGHLTAWGLSAGKDYYIKELEPPNGYTKLTNEIIHLNLSNTGKPKYEVIGHDDDWPFVPSYNQDDQAHNVTFTVQNEKLPARYSLDITKKDQEDKQLLPGAEFAVYTDANCKNAAELYDSEDAYNKGESPKNTFTVGEDGHLYAWGLYEGKNYYIKEVKPPAGYQEATDEVIHLDLSKSGASSYDVKGHDQTKKWDFVTDYSKNDTTHKIAFTVQNDVKEALVVDKQWFDIDGNDITYSVDEDEIQFKLYQIASTESHPDTGNVTVKMILNIPWWGQYVVTNQTNIPKGSTVRCTFATPRDQGAPTGNMNVGCTVNGSSVSVSQRNEQISWNSRKVFTLDDLVANQDIEIVISPANDGNEWLFQMNEHSAEYNVEVVKSPPPAPDPTPVTTELGTYSISKSNDWKWVRDDLPQTGVDKDGNKITYSYYVEEVPVEHYKAEYMNNGGISKGTITIKNTQTERPSYELPNTGGSGTLPYTIGGLMLIVLSGILLYKNIHRREDYISS